LLELRYHSLHAAMLLNEGIYRRGHFRADDAAQQSIQHSHDASLGRARGLTRRQLCCKPDAQLKAGCPQRGSGARRAFLLYYYDDIKKHVPGVRARS
jgi:hypothetical protein